MHLISILKCTPLSFFLCPLLMYHALEVTSMTLLTEHITQNGEQSRNEWQQTKARATAVGAVPGCLLLP